MAWESYSNPNFAAAIFAASHLDIQFVGHFTQAASLKRDSAARQELHQERFRRACLLVGFSSIPRVLSYYVGNIVQSKRETASDLWVLLHHYSFESVTNLNMLCGKGCSAPPTTLGNQGTVAPRPSLRCGRALCTYGRAQRKA